MLQYGHYTFQLSWNPLSSTRYTEHKILDKNDPFYLQFRDLKAFQSHWDMIGLGKDFKLD